MAETDIPDRVLTPSIRTYAQYYAHPTHRGAVTCIDDGGCDQIQVIEP